MRLALRHEATVVFRLQFLYMIPYRSNVALQRFGALGFGFGTTVILEGLERHLRIDNHVAVVGKVQYYVGNHLAPGLAVGYYVAVGITHSLLRFVFNAFGKPHVFEQFL